MYNYRLGDMFLNQHAWKAAVSTHKSTWPQSIASQYLFRTGADGDYGVLISIINEYESRMRPPADSLVVHLRVGDVFDKVNGTWSTQDNNWSVQRLWDETLDRYSLKQLIRYIMPRSFYEDQLRRVPSEIKQVVLVAGSHQDYPQFPRSTQYINLVHDFFVSKGYVVSMRLGNPADDDVAYMARAKHFVQSGGSFSRIIARVCERMGGHIYWTNPWVLVRSSKRRRTGAWWGTK